MPTWPLPCHDPHSLLPLQGGRAGVPMPTWGWVLTCLRWLWGRRASTATPRDQPSLSTAVQTHIPPGTLGQEAPLCGLGHLDVWAQALPGSTGVLGSLDGSLQTRGPQQWAKGLWASVSPPVTGGAVWLAWPSPGGHSRQPLPSTLSRPSSRLSILLIACGAEGLQLVAD